MTIRFLKFFFALLSLSLKSQNFNCEDFNQILNGNLRTKIDFVTGEYFDSIKKDSINIEPIKNSNEAELWKEFNKKFQNKITKNCIYSKMLINEKIDNISFCDEKSNIRIINKIENYYIFNVKAFEIDNYLLFNTNDETIYSFNSFPTILNNGNLLITMKFNSVYSHGIDIYKFENGDLKSFNYELSRQYLPEKTYIIKDWANRTKVLLNFIKYDLKEVSNTFKDGRKYEYDKDKSCRKYIIISE